MSIEQGSKNNPIRQTFEIARDIKRGYNEQQKARILRIVKDPSSVNMQDVLIYKEERFQSLAPILLINVSGFTYQDLTGVWREMERLDALPPQDLATEVQKDALQKVERWKLKIDA